MAKIGAIGDFLHYCEGYRYVSFDLFDTLIKRRFLHVHEVHQTAGMYAQALLGRLGEHSAADMASLRYRMGTALKASTEREIQEPTVEMVWDRLLRHEKGVVDEDERARLVQSIVAFEHSIELANLGLVEGGADLLRSLKARGVVITAISDMYFSLPQMQEILQKLGILEFFDHVYVSAEANLTKQTGDLFRRVVADLGIEPGEMLHVGDNAQSDIVMATAAGVPCVQVEQFPLLELERSAYGKRARVEQDVAAIIKAHLFSVLFDALSRRVDHIYFLARDGLAIRRFLTAWQSALRDRFLPVPEHSELYLNRVLTCWANVDFADPEWLTQAVGIAFWLKEGQAAAADISLLLGIPEVPEELGGDLLSSAADTARMVEAYRHAGLEPAIRAAIVTKRREVERYLSDIGFFDRKSVALVDVGYSGTVPRALSTLLMQAAAEGRELSPPAAVLHLIATFQNYETNSGPALPYVRFADQAPLPFSALPEGLRGYSWIELFFKHPSLLPVLGFVEQEGRLGPHLRQGEPYPRETPAQRVEQFAADDDEDVVFLWMAATGQFDALRDPVIERFANPDPETIAQMRDEIFELDPIAGTRRSIILEMPDAADVTIAEASRAGDYWIAGSIAASRMAAPAPPTARLSTDRQRGRNWLAGLLRRSRHRLRAAASGEIGFDAAFYRAFYPDLRHLPSDEALWNHYVRHGRAEQRIASRVALETRLRTDCGPIPADFEPEAYLAYNPDITLLVDTPERALDHYMRNGAREGRRYRPFLDDLIEDFETLREAGRITLSSEETYRHRRGAAVFTLYLARHGLVVGRWVDEIDVAEFRAMHSAWAGLVANRAECIVALCEHGLAHMPALSLRAPFDPVFYRLHDRSLETLDDAAVYRHYLNRGAAAGHAPSEAAALIRIWGHGEFPECFDWSGWRSRHPAEGPARGMTERLEALVSFLDANDDDRARWVSGEGSAHLLEAGARRARMRAKPLVARRLLEAALEKEGESGWIHHQLGDIVNDMGERAQAVAHYRKGLATAWPNRWSYLNAANLLLNEGDYATALAILEEGRAAWQETAPWRDVHTRALNAWLETCAGRIARSPAAEIDFSEIERIVAEVGRRIPRPIDVAASPGSLLILTSRTVSPRAADVALRNGVAVVQFGKSGGDDYLPFLLGCDEVILHELPVSAPALTALLLARALGRTTTFWLGDLADRDRRALSHLLWGERAEEGSAVRLSSVHAHALLARWCDQAVTTVAGCAELLSRLAPERPLHRIAAPLPPQRGPDKSRRVVLVGSTAQATRREREAIADGLIAAAAEDAGLEFIVDRDLSRIRRMATLAGRCSRLDGDPDIPSLARLAAVVDVVVVPRTGRAAGFDLMAEAASRGVSAIAVQLGEEPLLHSDGIAPDDLRSALREALTAPTARACGGQTGTAVSPSVAAPRTCASAAAASIRPPRILLANVWAPPQVIGGATRVMQDNIDYILDHHGTDFELAVFASDEHNGRCGEFTLDSYRGVPVFRVATPQEEHVYWRPANAQATARFSAVLDAFHPDLVHVHCLQRLGAGLAEACNTRNIPWLATLHDAWWLSDRFFLSDANACPVAARSDYFAQPRGSEFSVTESALRAQRLRAALAGAARRLSVSGSFAEVYRACGFEVDVVENGTSRLPSVRRPPRAAGGRVELCHIGGLEAHKGAFLIEAALRANDYANLRFTVIDLAHGPDYRFHTVWGTTPVLITGRMGSSELANFYASQDVLLAPSTCEESYGLVTREAIDHGLWVVAGNRGGLAEPVVAGQNGFVISVNDATELAAALAEIDADPNRYRSSPPRTGSLRTADDQARELVALYRSMVPPRRSADGQL